MTADNNRERWMSYMRGWGDGAKVSAMRREFTEHQRSDLREAYKTGYEDGRIARGLASKSAAEVYEYEPTVLRVTEEVRDTKFEITEEERQLWVDGDIKQAMSSYRLRTGLGLIDTKKIFEKSVDTKDFGRE